MAVSGSGSGSGSSYSDEGRSQQEPLAPWVPKQRRAFLGWFNAKLAGAGSPLAGSVTTLRALSDGVALGALVPHLVAGRVSVGRIAPHPRLKIQKMANISAALDALDADGVPVTAAASDVYAGNVKMVLGLLWVMILKYHIKSTADAAAADGSDAVDTDDGSDGAAAPGSRVLRSGKSAKADLLAWVRAQVSAVDPELDVADFGPAFQDGRVLAALTARFAPDATTYAELVGDSSSPMAIVEAVLRIAHTQLGIPELIEAADVVEDPDPFSIMTYVTYFRGAEAALRKGKLAHSADEFAALETRVASLETELEAETSRARRLAHEVQASHLTATAAADAHAKLQESKASLQHALTSTKAEAAALAASKARLEARLEVAEHKAALLPVLCSALDIDPGVLGDGLAALPDAEADSKLDAAKTALAAWQASTPSAAVSSLAAGDAADETGDEVSGGRRGRTRTRTLSLSHPYQNAARSTAIAAAADKGVGMGSMLAIADRIKASAVAARRAGSRELPAAPGELVIDLHARERELLQTLLATGRIELAPTDDLTAITGLDEAGNRAGPCCMYETLMHRVHAEVRELHAEYAALAKWSTAQVAKLGTSATALAADGMNDLADQVAYWRAAAADANAALRLEQARTLRAAQLFNGMEAFKENLQLRLSSTESSMDLLRKATDLNASASGGMLGTKPAPATTVSAVLNTRKVKNRRTAAEQALADEVSQLTGSRRGAYFKYGYLLKREKRRKTWTKLWLTLTPFHLEYRNNKNDQEPRGRIALEGCVVNEVSGSQASTIGIPNTAIPAFCIHLRMQNRKDYYFLAESLDEVAEWKNGLSVNIAVNESLKTMVANARSCDDSRILEAFRSKTSNSSP
ncbi:uncharacterized protein AMSG_07009 [Thecamonas trahens ATCC 50062]|uniref:Uncharacterized protein n=1 Tax=Thecamonas trahens ATCC 50062 TaxID=461836 RepID=A0A0L0DFU0_THETB|nr:hypothetical protein AMSG_07009 [Thecamonas trahens ATCC 50062]KNC51031.1 hypothetical protein AMSG_07009 [Thecamonas trahens ATCC 50062]|eukprot:XP_013756498.1 hypothetical protein AMSG_07009 [Thecamonas trahens ATCC 50062]